MPALVTEIAVIGAGPGGYPAAFACADHGKQVVMVDQSPQPGGVCLHRGCIPSKALLHLAKLIGEARDAAAHGVTFGPPKIDIDAVRKFKNDVIGKLVGGIGQLQQGRGVKFVQARAKFASAQTLTLEYPDGTIGSLEFQHAILATGSSPVMPAAFNLGDPRVMDSTGALDLADVPRRLLVVGGGYIGLEMGSVYAALGSKVVVVEMLAGLLPGADRDLVRPLQKRLEGLFESIRLETKVASLEASSSGITARLTGADGATAVEQFDRVLVSIGRRPNSANLGLENTKIQLDSKGFVPVDAKRRTVEPTIFAIGDVAGEPMLAHKATREAKVVAEVLAGEPAEFDNVAIPAVVFTDPELAWCGLTEAQAKEGNLDVKVVRFPWAASGRAQSLGRTEGLTKIICEAKTDRILGVGIVGAGAGELISEGVIAVETAAVARELADSIHPHPTLSETLMEAAEAIIGQATHMYRPKR
ncbi:MAG: dihydrolipoyl dehydrogenase [Planctomycetaceae bacterium]|nr:MAG: dihydrolipoyl dehydrogenase [Planctomycetaceae bacterium]